MKTGHVTVICTFLYWENKYISENVLEKYI